MAKRTKKRNERKQSQLVKSEFARLKKWIMSLFGFLVAVVFTASAYTKEELLWRKSDTGIDENRISAICIIKEAPQVIFAGGERAIYKSVNSGKSWYRVLMLKGPRKVINFIAYDPSDTYKIFAGTGNGLYISSNGGKSWRRHFKGRDDLQREVTCIAIDNDNPNLVFIATRRGLFQSKDAGRHWLSHNSFVNKEILSVAIGNNAIYVCAIGGVYCAKKKALDLWERIYVQKTSEEEDVNGDNDNSNADEEKKISRLNHISIYENRVYLATDRGVFICKEAKEKEWQMLSSVGLLTKNIRFVLPFDKGIFVTTDKGVFSYNEKHKRWSSISSGLISLRVNSLDFVPEKASLYAATDRGIYKTELNNTQTQNSPPMEYRIEAVISREPTISEIRQAAIEYAEVSPRKIKWMRRAARNKAWLPKVTAGLDGDIYRTLDIDRGSTSKPDFYIEGPKDKRWGWDVNVTWDLGQLIWNDDQTNIDVRSKLMVQLRNDVLNEVTKLYFERRRLQLELCTSPPKAEKQKALKRLRLDELTADIDSLTGGYLSEGLRKY